MRNKPDTFRGLIRNVTCSDCPLRSVRENVWRAGVKPGVTPFDAAEDVGRVVHEMHERTQETVPEVEDCIEGSDIEDLISTTIEEAISDLSGTTTPLNREISQAIRYPQERVPKNIADTVKIGTAVGQCVAKQVYGGCTLDPTAGTLDC